MNHNLIFSMKKRKRGKKNNRALRKKNFMVIYGRKVIEAKQLFLKIVLY